MSVGCFSWCRSLRKLLLRTHVPVSQEQDENSLRNGPPTYLDPKDYTSFEEQRIIPNESNEKSSTNNRAAVPLRSYIAASGKEVLTILESAAGIIPVPMLQEAIGVALKIMELCEEASAVEEKVKELQVRVGHIMIIVLTHVTDKNEQGDGEIVIKAAKSIEGDIKELLSTLETINKDLAQIKAQNRWMITFYKDLNMGTVDDCLANDLRDSELLQGLRTRLGTMTDQVNVLSKDMKHVVTAVDDIQHNFDSTRQAFDEVLSRVKMSTTQLSSEMVIRQQIPLKPEVFYGRDNLVKEIVQALLKEDTSRVCILGAGGMGKTSVSLAVAESPLVEKHFSRGKRAWVPCIGASSATLLLEVLYLQLRVPGDRHVTLEKIISELGSSDAPHLILLDNFETPWNTTGAVHKEVEDILRQLAKLSNVAILLTMRGKYPPCDNSIAWQSKNIEPTDEESSRHIFHGINPSSKDDPDVPRLLRALGYMPFAVTLMASLGKEGQSTAAELLTAWSESGPDIISGMDPENSMNRSISLSVDSHLVQQNSNALLLLNILSLLPEGTTKENLRWWAPTLRASMIPSAIAILSKAALLLENKQQSSDTPILFVVPVVQSFMQHGRIPDEVRKQVLSSCCQYVLDHACRYDEAGFQAKAKALAAEDSNIQSLLFGHATTQDSPLPVKTMEAIIAFCWYRCDMKPSPDLAQQAMTMAEASGIEKYIALAEWCLGRTYYLCHTIALAVEHLRKAYARFSAPGDIQWQTFAGRCGIDLVDSAWFVEDKEEIVRLAHEVEGRCATLSNNQVHGRSLSYLGFILQEHQQTSQALCYLDRAKTLLGTTSNAVDISEVYQAIGRVHRRERRFSEALEAMKEAWKHAELSNVPYVQADISLDMGGILLAKNRDADAMNFFEIALTKNSYVGNQFQVAVALEYMGYGYIRQGQFQDAHSAYVAAVETYLRSGIATQPHSERCKENIAKIEQKLSTTPNDLIGFRRPHWDSDQSLFYPSAPLFAAGDLPGSAS